MTNAIATAASGRTLRLALYLAVAAGIALVALAAGVSPTLAAEAAETTSTAGEPVDLAPIGAGLIALFVGFVELILEFVKPITLSMRLFGNIYGGEVALAIVVALAGAFLIPVALYGLEIILTTIQALIFATLTLMFIIAAMESHSEEGHEEEEVLAAESIAGTDTDQGAAATA